MKPIINKHQTSVGDEVMRFSVVFKIQHHFNTKYCVLINALISNIVLWFIRNSILDVC